MKLNKLSLILLFSILPLVSCQTIFMNTVENENGEETHLESKPQNQTNNSIDIVENQGTTDIYQAIERMISFPDSLKTNDRVYQHIASDYSKVVYYTSDFELFGVYDATLDKEFRIKLPYTNNQLALEKMERFYSWNEDASAFALAIIDPQVRVFGAGTIFICSLSTEDDAYTCFSYVPDDIDDREDFALGGIKPQPDYVQWAPDGESVAVLYSDYQEIDIINMQGVLLHQVPLANLVKENSVLPYVELVGWTSASDGFFLYGRSNSEAGDKCKIMKVSMISEDHEIIGINHCYDHFSQFDSFKIDKEVLFFTVKDTNFGDLITCKEEVIGIDLDASDLMMSVGSKCGTLKYGFSESRALLGVGINNNFLIYDLQKEELSSYEVSGYELAGWFEEIESFVLFKQLDSGLLDFIVIP